MVHDAHSFLAALEALRSGEPAIFPTDTLFGVGVSVRDAQGPEALYALKHREARKPIAWLVPDATALERYGADVSDAARALAHVFWPGPLTLIVKAAPSVPSPFRSAQGTIGLRMPDDAIALTLIEALGCPVATTSANISGLPPARSFDQLDAELIAHAAALDDGRRFEASGVASTIVDCTGDAPRILREGSITRRQVLSVL